MLTLAEVAELLGVAPPGQHCGRTIRGMNTLELASDDELSVVATEQFVRGYRTTRAAAVLVDRRIRLPLRPEVPALAVEDADAATAFVLTRLAPPVPQPIGVHPSAVIDPSTRLHPSVAVGPHVVVGARVTLGQNVRLHANVVVMDDVTLGDDCVLFPNVVIRERVTVGRRVTINAGAVLGTDGFGYRWDGQQHAKIPQIGTVVIEDDVEIGSCTCIDRAKFSQTRVGRGTKIDNLVQIGHNVRTGPHCIITGQVGIAGSATLGTGVVLGGQTAVRDHLVIGDGAMAAGHSVIASDVEAKTVVSGMPALPHRQTLREQHALRSLPDLKVQVRRLQEEIEQLKASVAPRE